MAGLQKKSRNATRLCLTLLIVSQLTACGILDSKYLAGDLPKSGTLVPATAVHVTPSYTTQLHYLLDKALSAAVLNYVYQPLDPNWDVADVPLSADTHRFALRMKRFSTGGDGEAWITAKRYAERLQAAKGASGFVFVEFTQGIDSSTPFARRVAEGLVRFSDVPPDPAAGQPLNARPG